MWRRCVGLKVMVTFLHCTVVVFFLFFSPMCQFLSVFINYQHSVHWGWCDSHLGCVCNAYSFLADKTLRAKCDQFVAIFHIILIDPQGWCRMSCLNNVLKSAYVHVLITTVGCHRWPKQDWQFEEVLSTWTAPEQPKYNVFYLNYTLPTNFMSTFYIF